MALSLNLSLIKTSLPRLYSPPLLAANRQRNPACRVEGRDGRGSRVNLPAESAWRLVRGAVRCRETWLAVPETWAVSFLTLSPPAFLNSDSRKYLFPLPAGLQISTTREAIAWAANIWRAGSFLKNKLPFDKRVWRTCCRLCAKHWCHSLPERQ